MKIIAKILLISSVFMISGCDESISSGNHKTQSSYYQDIPTYQQWQNVEALNYFMAILEALVNSSGSCSSIWHTDSYGYQRYRQYGYYDPWMR